MKNRVCLSLCVILMALLSSVITPQSSLAVPIPTGDTEDILYMADGRILHGQILSENDLEVVFEYTHKALGITTKLTLQKENVSKMDRNVAVAVEAEDVAEEEAFEREPDENFPKDQTYLHKLKNQYGASLAHEDPSLPGVYVIPMRGQMGTDVHIEFYKKTMDEIRRLKPDLLVFELDCSDAYEGILMIKDELEALDEWEEETGIMDLEQYRDMVNMFHDELRDIPQVMWVKDSVGISSVVALAWKDFYMHPDARLDGIGQIYLRVVAQFADPQVRAKMIAAWTATANSFLEYGQHPLAIGNAMMNPNLLLGATWKGRDVIWSLDGTGQYIVDGSDKETTSFTAKTAEDFCLTNGTAESLDDLMLLKGYREYRLIQGSVEKEFTRYVKSWRQSLDTAVNSMNDYTKHMSWATGEDTLKYLGRAKSDLKRVLAAMKRYDAVRVRLEQEGLSTLALTVLVERIKERIRALRRGERGSGGTGGGGNAPRGGRGG